MADETESLVCRLHNTESPTLCGMLYREPMYSAHTVHNVFSYWLPRIEYNGLFIYTMWSEGFYFLAHVIIVIQQASLITYKQL